MISIYLNDWCWRFFSLYNSMMEYRSVYSWNNCNWNISSISNIKCFDCFTICSSDWISNIMSRISFMNWYINISIYYNLSFLRSCEGDVVLIIHFNYSFRNSCLVNFYNFISKDWLVDFWNSI